MDSDKPKRREDDARDPAARERDRAEREARRTARERAESLGDPDGGDSKGQGPDDGGAKGGDEGRKGSGGSGDDASGRRPRLTEKQRAEARRQRRSSRKRPATGNALSRGLRATGHEIRRTAAFLGRSVLAGLDALRPLGGIITAGLAGLLGRIGRVLAFSGRLLGHAVALAGRLAVVADRVVTPRRALLAVAAVAAAVLAVSQFTDYRAIEVGQAGYDPVADITHAPRVEVENLIGAHSILLFPVAALAALALAGTALTRRRAFPAAVAVAGLAALAVGLLIDLPKGLDSTGVELLYAGAEPVLLSGFWLQLSSGAVLAVSGLALVRNPAARPGEARRSRRAAAPGPAVAGGSA